MTSFQAKKRQIFQRLQRIFHSGRNAYALHYAIKHDALIEKALNSSEMGVASERLCGHEVVVSLTTYGRRLYDVAPTIESIMQGSLKPNRIVLWLGEDLRGTTLPVTLKKQQKRGLEICYCEDIRSYKKLVPTLGKCPEAVIITIDDDAIYWYDTVERLVNEHCRFPDSIIANRVHRVKLGKNGRPLGYMDWDLKANPGEDSALNFFTGVGGVLYPPHCLDPEVMNSDVFLDICKHADDIWFYAMALKAGTHVRKCPTHALDGRDFIMNYEVQDSALKLVNTNMGSGSQKGRCENDVQFEAVFERYALWDKLREG